MFYDKLSDYQQKSVELLEEIKTLALFFDQGTGKTWCTVAMIERLLTPDFKGLAVVPLTSLKDTWLSLLSAEIPSLGVFHTWAAFKAADGPKLLLTHYENFVKECKYLRAKHWDFCVFDESQKLMNRNTKQSRAAAKLRDVDYRVILSGTPVEQSPIDLWSQFRFLRPELLGSWGQFDTAWLKPCGYMGYDRKMKPELVSKFLKLVAPYCYRVDRSILGLEEPDLVPVYIDLLGPQKQVYDEMENASFSESLGVSAELKVTQIVKLHQITGGFVKDDEGEARFVGMAKIRKVRSLIKKLEKPVVIFCKYDAEREALSQALEEDGLRVAQLHGGIKDTKRQAHRSELIRDFREGKYDAMVSQIRVGSVSLNLQVASNLIIYSMSYSYVDFSQIIARIHRRGQKKKTTIYVILARFSIDIPIYDAVSLKQSVSKTVTQYLKRKHRHGC